MKPTLYLETTVPSYLTAWSSRDVVMLAHQQVTHEWWESRREAYEVFISQIVLDEAAMGDTAAARRRLALLTGFPLLDITQEVERLAAIYLQQIPLPEKAFRDALHLAIACAHGMDYLVTWNCTHIARGEVKRALESINAQEGIVSPTICTPEELLGE